VDVPASAVELEGVSFSFASAPSRKVLDSVSLEVARGEFLGIVGPTGSGKSTLLQCMNGIIPGLVEGRMEGKALLFGEPVGGSGPARLAGKAGLLFQDPDSQLFAGTVSEEVAFGPANIGLKGEELSGRVASSLGKVGMLEFSARNPRELSFGQKQKVALASIIAMGPSVLLLDEPVSALDHSSAEAVYSLVSGLNSEGITVVAVEHNTEFLAERAKRIVLLRGGRVAADGTPEEVFGSPAAREAGVRVPCSARIGESLGLGAAPTPEELCRRIRHGGALA
jgi:energy-coupling factor transporter ATP-binding protein EcfA2